MVIRKWIHPIHAKRAIPIRTMSGFVPAPSALMASILAQIVVRLWTRYASLVRERLYKSTIKVHAHPTKSALIGALIWQAILGRIAYGYV